MSKHYDILDAFAIANGYSNGAHMCALMGYENGLKAAGFRYSDSECGGPSYWYHEDISMYKDAMREDPRMASLERAERIRLEIADLEKKMEKLRNERNALRF